MSNPSLPPVGFKYIIDDSEINAAVARIEKNYANLGKRSVEVAKQIENALVSFAKQADITFNEKLQRYVDNGTKRIISQADAIARTKAALQGLDAELGKIDRASAGSANTNASARSLRLLSSELVYLTGVGGQATGILSGFISATSTLDRVVIGAVGALLLAKSGVDALQASFEKQQRAIANTARSYDELYQSRLRALTTTPQGAAVGIPDALGALRESTFEGLGTRFGSTFGTAFIEGAAGVLTPARLAQLFILDIQSPVDFARKISEAAAAKFAKTQQEGATANYVFAAGARTAALALEEEVNNLIASGAATDVLIPKVYALQQALIAAGRASGTVTGASIDADIAGRRERETRQGSAPVKGLDYLSPIANQLASELLAAQAQFNSQYASAAADHEARLNQIAAQGGEARARIQRNYERTLRDIQESLQESQAQAAADRAERIADAEQNAQERREQLAQDYADRRIEIERTYQDRVKDVNEQYGVSVLDATIRRDATALLRAKDAKARGLRDAAEARQKDADKAKADYDKQKKQLDDALAKQRADIERDYRKRIDAAEAQARKAQAKAKENYDEALSDQQQAEAQARKSEKDSYTARQAQLATAFAARKAAIVAALAEEKNLTEAQAKAIITSLKGILNPAQITELLKALQQAIQAKIDITITPFAPPKTTGSSTPGVGPVLAYGGYKATSGGAYLHAGEWVLPNPVTAGMARFSDVLSSALRQYTAPVAQLAGRGGGESRITLEVLLNDGMLDARIVRGAINASVKVIKGSSSR